MDKKTEIIIGGTSLAISALAIIGLNIIGIISLVCGFAMLGFSMWQLNMLTSPIMDGDVNNSITFFTDLKGNGYKKWREMPWTMNQYIWPNMTAGEAYDWTMVMNFASVAPIGIGLYLLMQL